ncbi:hypothetical protein [Brachyspira pilosicoli]|uniref:hypothetical protein n=1 Tax=Brachyspira pilosicoli TaxID=52584 RepID=UPI0030056E9F
MGKYLTAEEIIKWDKALRKRLRERNKIDMEDVVEIKKDVSVCSFRLFTNKASKPTKYYSILIYYKNGRSQKIDCRTEKSMNNKYNKLVKEFEKNKELKP